MPVRGPDGGGGAPQSSGQENSSSSTSQIPSPQIEYDGSVIVEILAACRAQRGELAEKVVSRPVRRTTPANAKSLSCLFIEGLRKYPSPSLETQMRSCASVLPTGEAMRLIFTGDEFWQRDVPGR